MTEHLLDDQAPPFATLTIDTGYTGTDPIYAIIAGARALLEEAAHKTPFPRTKLAADLASMYVDHILMCMWPDGDAVDRWTRSEEARNV